MKTEDKVRQLAAQHSATLTIDNHYGNEVWELWLPRGRQWVETGGRCLCQCYGNFDQSWQRDAYRELVESVNSGIINK